MFKLRHKIKMNIYMSWGVHVLHHLCSGEGWRGKEGSGDDIGYSVSIIVRNWILKKFDGDDGKLCSFEFRLIISHCI